MNRRDFFGIAAASIFAPRFGRWYRQGSGLIVPAAPELMTATKVLAQNAAAYALFAHNPSATAIRAANRELLHLWAMPIAIPLSVVNAPGFSPGSLIRTA